MFDNLYYDGEEKDERLEVVAWEPSPFLPQGGHFFDGMHFDERGLVLIYNDGSNLKPRTYQMQIVFSGGFDSLRTYRVSAHQESKLGFYIEKAGVSDFRFHAYKCRYTNYFNWCIEQTFDRDLLERYGCHYILVACDTWVEIFSMNPPRVFFDAFGMKLSQRDLELNDQYPACDMLYQYQPPQEKF